MYKVATIMYVYINTQLYDSCICILQLHKLMYMLHIYIHNLKKYNLIILKIHELMGVP